MQKIMSIGTPPWTRQDLLDKLEQFADLYSRRPIKDNTGGMKSPHMFYTWIVLQYLQPEAVVESGVFKGQSTWLIEQVCPEAQIYSIDPFPTHIQYRSSKAEYFYRDFSTLDWQHLPKEKTLLFFDDHQDAYERVKTAHWFGFQHMIFDDNYPAKRGDCYSLKKAFMGAGMDPLNPSPPLGFKPWLRHGIRTILRPLVRKAFNIDYSTQRWVQPNLVDASYLQYRLETYYEFPAIFKPDYTAWGEPWTDAYPMHEPLLQTVTANYQDIYKQEADKYVWLCYAKLR